MLSRRQAGLYSGHPLSASGLTPYRINEPRRHRLPKAGYKIDGCISGCISLTGRLGKRRSINHGKRLLTVIDMFRYERLNDRSLQARTLPTRKTEVKVTCNVIPSITVPRMPVSRRVAGKDEF
jgi:hypothetical protein